MVKQLKNRYNDLDPAKFVIGIDRPKMRLYDINGPTDGIVQGTSSNPATELGQSPFAKANSSSGGAERFKGFTI